jgi:GNAT superfamily N-acetyltransferase
MGVVVRRAEPVAADRSTLARLRRHWAEEDAGGAIADPAYEARAVAWIEANETHRLAWIAELDDVAAGMLTVVVVERMPEPGTPTSGWGYLHHFFVEPRHRSQGVGAALLSEAISDAAERGWSQLVLHPRPRSVSLYARAGFEPADLIVLHL